MYRVVCITTQGTGVAQTHKAETAWANFEQACGMREVRRVRVLESVPISEQHPTGWELLAVMGVEEPPT